MSSDTIVSNGSSFVDPERVLADAEARCQDIETIEEEDRYTDESYMLALWDEVRRLRRGIRECLRENAHLADGNNCTLAGIKRLLP